MQPTTFTISIAGASGYTGMECIRYLLGHPQFTLGQCYGESSAGQTIDGIYPAFSQVVDRTILPFEHLMADTSDALVLALPHGMSAEVAHKLITGGYKGKIIDIGSDFRLKRTSDYRDWYRMEHPHPDLLKKFLYALPEFNRNAVKGHDYVANPGCFATAVQLAAIPLAQSGLVNDLYVTGLTGSSGSGAKASDTTHYTNRFGNLKAYKVFEHQHMGEIMQNLVQQSPHVPEIHFTPVSAPIVRGIWVTISGRLRESVSVAEMFEMTYYNAPLVRIRQGLPELKPVIGTAFADIGWKQKGDHFVVGVAIDNMGKGAAGQAIQNLNLMFDLEEDSGLIHPGIVL